MDYYTAMEDAMVQAREDSLLPTKITREQMLASIEEITQILKGSLSNGERIILSAQRQELRLRLLRAEEVAQRLMGETNVKQTQT